MSLEKKPFVNYTVGEKQPLEYGKVITVRMNPEEYKSLMVMAKTLHISRDSTVLKKLALVGQNVILSTFGIDFMRWLLDEERIVNDSKLDKLTIETKENVIQKIENL
jgi:hypothetical protein